MLSLNKFYSINLLLFIVSNIFIPQFSPQLATDFHKDDTSIEFKSSVPDIEYKISTTELEVLVVLMELPDDPHNPSHTRQYYEDLFFSLSNPASVSQYYNNVSYGEVLLDGDVLGWYPARENLSYYGSGTRKPPGTDAEVQLLVDEARSHATQNGSNPQDYDLFVVIHSGDGQEYSGNSDDIWSHQFNIQYLDDGWKFLDYTINHEYVDYKTPSHELGHALYFPDLYDLNYEHEFAGPYAMMDNGAGHFSIWNKYYSKISRPDSAQFLNTTYRMQISDFLFDSYVTINPLGIIEPNGIMWIELDWDSSGYANTNHGKGWTVTVRENIDYDTFLPKHGVIIAEIQVGPRTITEIQVADKDSPSWKVIDSHPETKENKDDAAFSLADGDISTFFSGQGWAVQLLEKYDNLSYRVRVTNESNIPNVLLTPSLGSVSSVYSLIVEANSSSSFALSSVEISIDNKPWQNCTFNVNSGKYSFEWNTTKEREGTHLIRARAVNNASIPYLGYSDFVVVEVDNIDGNILVVDDDLGRTSEESILNALDNLGLASNYDIKQTTSFTEAEITSEEMSRYEFVLWIGNPDITPLSNSHINYNEFKEIKKYLANSTRSHRSRIMFMCSYNIFDFSNQGIEIHNEITDIFRASSPVNFRAPVNLLQGYDFLEDIDPFTLGKTDTLFSNQTTDGEVVTLLSGVNIILRDESPVFPGYDTKGYYIDTGDYKIVNYLFQPEMVPESILLDLINATLHYMQLPNKQTFKEMIELLVFISFFSVCSIGTASLLLRKFKR